jgi:hypothetical protein
MPQRRAASAALSAASDVFGNILQRRANSRIAEEQAKRQDLYERGRTADENVASGKWTPEQGAAYKRGESIEPSVQQEMAGMMTGIDKAPNVGEVPTVESLGQQMTARRIPSRYGPMTAPPGSEYAGKNLGQIGTDISGNLPAKQMGQISPEFNQILGAREAKLNSFPPVPVDEVVPGAGGTSVKRRRFLAARPDRLMGQDIQIEPTAQQAGANKQIELMGGELSAPVTTAKAEQAGKTQTATTRAQQQQEIVASGLTTQQQSAALALSDNFTAESKGFYTVQDNMRRMHALSQEHSGASDLGMVFAFNKILDEMGSVREGEQERVAGAASLLDRLSYYMEHLKTGGTLPDPLRADLLRQSVKMYNAASVEHGRRVQDYSARAMRLKIDPSLVVRQAAPDLAEGHTPEGSSSVLDLLRAGKAYGPTQR